MSAEEFIDYLAKRFGIGSYPKTFKVDSKTYANLCQFLFNKLASDDFDLFQSKLQPYYQVKLSLGTQTKGLMFKAIEIILSEDDGTDF